MASHTRMFNGSPMCGQEIPSLSLLVMEVRHVDATSPSRSACPLETRFRRVLRALGPSHVPCLSLPMSGHGWNRMI